MAFFNQNRYKDTIVGPEGRVVEYFDGSDALANLSGFKIIIQHVSTGKSIEFKAFITAFNDTFSQNWNSQEVYGRADPIYNFKNTSRKISLGFKMVAASESEAYENLTKAQLLSQFMYPNYTDIDGAKTVSQAPLIRLSIMNLLQKTKGTQNPSLDGKSIYDSYEGYPDEGVLGFFDNVTFNWNLENNEAGVFQKDGAVLPKLIEVQVGGFSPIHEQHLGWDENGNFGRTIDEKTDDAVYQNTFPYGTTAVKEIDNFENVVFVEQSATEFPKPAYSEEELSKDEKAQAEAAIANAQARYGGMFGNMRKKRDEKRLMKGKLSGDKGAYVASALAGQAAIESGFLDDGSLSNTEMEGINIANEVYDIFVE